MLVARSGLVFAEKKSQNLDSRIEMQNDLYIEGKRLDVKVVKFEV